MAESSKMLPLGTIAPDFTLFDTVSQKNLSLKELQSKHATVIMFICNHCPYVKHLQKKIVEMALTYQAKGVAFIAINSNDITAYPEDGPLHMQEVAKSHRYPFPYLFDETQVIAKAYQAACTPDFYVFDGQMHCIYRGRFDGSTPKNDVPVTGHELAQALDNVLLGKPVDENQLASIGCGIKWKMSSRKAP